MEGRPHTDSMHAQTIEGDAKHVVALPYVGLKGVQSQYSPRTWLLLKVLLHTIFSVMLALSLVLCVVYRHQHGEHNAQHAQVEERSVVQPRGWDGRMAMQHHHQSVGAVVAPENLSSQMHLSLPDLAIFNRISRKARRKPHALSQAKMNSFVKILEDLMQEELLKLHQRILCLDAHADKEVVALKERGFKDVQGIKLLPMHLNPEHTHENTEREKLADQGFDFFFTTMFDRMPYPTLFVAEIERTLTVGGFAAMHVSLNKWRNKYISSEAGRYIKPVTLLFQHSEIVYVSSAYAPGLDTIIVFKKTTHERSKRVDQMEINKKQQHDNLSMPQLIVNQVELSTKHKSRKYTKEQQLKSSRYTPLLQESTRTLLFTNMHDTFLPSSVTHPGGDIVIRKSVPIGLPIVSNLDTLYVQGLTDVAELNRAVGQDGIFASELGEKSPFSDGKAHVRDNLAVDS